MSIKTTQSRDREGFTLVEMLVAISLSAVLLSINAVWIYQTMKFSSQVGQRHRDHQDLTRLAGDFRDDVRRCKTIRMIDEKSLELTLAAAGDSAASTATYTINGSAVALIKRSSGALTKQERFKVSENSIIQWDDSEMPETISLIVSRDPAKLPTEPEQLVTLLHLRVSRNRWAIKQLAKESEEKSEEKTEEKQSQKKQEQNDATK